MIDLHKHPANWGIRPILFRIGEINIDAYAFFVMLGLSAGLLVYYILAKKEKKLSENSFYVLMAGLLGGIIGSKIPIWIFNYKEIISGFPDIALILSGRTITGGLIGGTIAVILVKKKLNIKEKKGNLFAPGIALGVAIGRIGCFLRGCCYGIETALPWGVDFGDGIKRHPTQIYESLFMLGLFFILLYKRKNAKPGELYYILINSYFGFRFFEEFIKESPRFFGLTLFHYISIFALVIINAKYIYERRIKK